MILVELVRGSKWRTLVILLIAILCVMACSQDNGGTGRPEFMPPVTVTRIAKTDADVLREYPARIQGSRQVRVRAMVQGILKKKLYEEGYMVEANRVLFLIDPEPYQIALRRAQAEYADASANHDNALRERERYVRLYEQKAVSEQERDRAETQYELGRARMELADAAVADARRNLRYTEVRAPVAGVTDIESISEGNLIEWGQPLTTITQIDPVHIVFSIPERDAMAQRFALLRATSDNRYREAVLIFPDGTEYDVIGEIDFTARTTDPQTGTFNARAVFSNPDSMLVPGQFVRVRVLLETLEQVILINEEAVSQGREGKRVFLVDDGDVAREQLVSTGQIIEGKQAILSGLSEGDRVVIGGHVALRDGMKVSIDKVLEGSSGSTVVGEGREVR